jgi:hypothetical protein
MPKLLHFSDPDPGHQPERPHDLRAAEPAKPGHGSDQAVQLDQSVAGAGKNRWRFQTRSGLARISPSRLLDRLPEPGIDPAQVTRLSGLIELADEAAVTLVGVTTAP